MHGPCLRKENPVIEDSESGMFTAFKCSLGALHVCNGVFQVYLDLTIGLMNKLGVLEPLTIVSEFDTTLRQCSTLSYRFYLLYDSACVILPYTQLNC